MGKIKFEYIITGLYVVLGSLWIVFSDRLLGALITDPVMLTHFQTYKGWFYVLTTAVIFYIILSNHLVMLRRAEKKAKESDRLKSAFLQNISHEVRTPMNSITGFTELLTETGLTDEKRVEYLGIINASCIHLLNVVDSIIEISMIESGNITVTEKDTNLNRVLDEIYSFHRPMIRTGVTFSLEKGLPDREALIKTDETKLNKIISNLLNNAIKFTDRGHIIFGYKTDYINLEFFIEDTGKGIPEDFKNKIFSAFQKADNDPDKLYEGLGLGLSICKGNVDLLNGNMWVESQTGIGTKFYFTIPYKPASY